MGASSERSRTILIVEDNILNLKLFSDLLDANGYRTLTSRTGPEGIALARQHHPDLILLDLQLPEISGIEIAKWLKQDDTLSGIPVVVVSAFSPHGDIDQLMQWGCAAYCPKPISARDLLNTVGSLLH